MYFVPATCRDLCSVCVCACKTIKARTSDCILCIRITGLHGRYMCVCVCQAVVVKRRSLLATVKLEQADVSVDLSMPVSTVTGIYLSV